MSQDRLQYIMQQWMDGKVTDTEVKELTAYLQAQPRDEALPGLLAAWMDQNTTPGDHSQVWEKRMSGILALDRPARVESGATTPVHRIHFLRTAWFRYAAILLLVTGTAAYFYITSQPSFRRNPEVAKHQEASSPQNIPPGGNKAVLTLAGGQTIILDSAANGTLADQGGAKVVKLANGQIVYNFKGAATGEVMWNTMSTPKGGQYQLVLPDGSKVWLNAASSILFPTAFNKDRTVEITGESYFEIAADKKKPFFVKAGQTTIQVLGTSFNVNAYDEGPAIKTSLLEGRVKIGTTLLKPGEAFQAGTIVATNIDQDIAWKNGVFDFEGVGVSELMHQVERWYDVNVVYEGAVPKVEFVGKVKRDLPLPDLLKTLQKMGVNVTQAPGRTVIVAP